MHKKIKIIMESTATSTCAACGKEGNSSDMNICNKCKEVKYCNATCKKKHRTKYKKACERRVAELYDEKLFKEVEPEECPICLLPMPIRRKNTTFEPCCGKRICNGCSYAMEMSEGKDLCAFCRTPKLCSDEEMINRTKKLIDNGNALAFYFMAGLHAQGLYGMPQDRRKANEFNLKAGELGCADGYHNLGIAYYGGRGVEVDKKKAKHYFELAAMNGNVNARHNLSYIEEDAGNNERACRHMLLAARAGHEKALEEVTDVYRNEVGLVAKEEYASTLRAYHERRKEMKSDERDKASIYYA